jgi:Na+/melibiose symporter-like transporter
MKPVHAIPRGVWVLGFVSMLMDISSEMIHGLLPLYLTVSLGASALTVGVIEGLAEATAFIVKVFSGTLSDRWRKRKAISAFGYGLAAFSKPLFALASGPMLVFFARFLDRIGKGIRGAPRDALIADLTPREIRGAAFGLRQSLDTVGAFAGPFLAMALMLAWNDDFRAVFWVAVIPAILSFLLIAFAVREPEAPPGAAKAERIRLDRATMRSLGRAFWGIAAAATSMALARSTSNASFSASTSSGRALRSASMQQENHKSSDLWRPKYTPPNNNFNQLSPRSRAATSIADFASRSLPACKPSGPQRSTPHLPWPMAK